MAGVARPATWPVAAERSGAAVAVPVPREQWIDTLRVLVIAGVIVVHLATTYIVPIDWYYQERTTSELWRSLLYFPTVIGGAFGLGPLFLVAGWLAVRSVARRGRAGFARARLLRLGVPLLVFVLVVDPLADYVGDVGEGGAGGPFLAYFHPDSVGPMWFVAALLAFSLVFAGLPRRHPLAQPAGPPRPALLVLAVATIALGSLLVWQLSSLATKDFLNLTLSEWPQAAVLFALGVHAADRGWLNDIPGRLERRLGAIALVGLAALMAVLLVRVALGQIEELVSGFGWQTVALAILDGVVAVSGTLWLVAWLRPRLPATGALFARAGRASYAAYFVHPLVLAAMGTLLASVALAPELKFVLVTPAAVPACFVVGYILTRVPGISKVL